MLLRSNSEKRFTLLILEYLEEIKKGENNIVLFGSVGNGKTYLLNKACGEDYPAYGEGYSCTRNVQFALSKKYDMRIIDFPGLNAVTDIIGHLKIQKTALSAIPVRMICFVIKYSPRNDDFERELGQMLMIFQNYIENILIIITKTEEISKNIKRKGEIEFLFKNKFNIGNVLFTEKGTKDIKLCEELNKFKNKMKNIKQILVKTRDLTKTIPSLYNKDMAKEREEFEDKFYETLDLFKKEVEKAVDPDLKRALYFAFKDYKDILLQEYNNVIRNKKIDGKAPDEDSVIAEILMFDNNLFNEFNEFRKLVESYITISSTTYNGEYNRFKKCPHCGLIWFKVIGCNSVQCGKRTKVKDKIVGRYKKYIVVYKDNKIHIQCKDLGEYNNNMDKMMINDLDNNTINSNSTRVNTNNNTMMNNNMMNRNDNIMNNMNNNLWNSNSTLMNSNENMNNNLMNSNNNMNINMMNNNMMNNNMNNDMNNNNTNINMMNNNMNNNNMNNNNMNNNMMNNNMNNNNMNNNNMNNIIINNNMNNMMNYNLQMQMQQMNQMMPLNIFRPNNIENDNEFFGLTEKETNENIKRNKKGLVLIKPLGCGRELNWNEMEDCSDEVIEKLKEIAVDDYHAGILKISDEMKKINIK